MATINEHFKLPIYYNESKMKTNQTIIDDLELTKTIDPSANPIYSYFFDNTNEFSNDVMAQATEYYTTDTKFLTETQQLLKTWKHDKPQDYAPLNSFNGTSISVPLDSQRQQLLINQLNSASAPREESCSVSNLNRCKRIREIWTEIKSDTGFKEKYYYIDWTMFEYLNKSNSFLQLMSFYNMISPVLSLCIPILFLILPFFIIRFKGLTLTMAEYLDILKLIASNHSIGKLFTSFHDVTSNEKAYMIVSAGFYLFSIYQNILVCIRFNSNMTKIYKFLQDIHTYLDHTTKSMEQYIDCASQYETYSAFNTSVQKNMDILLGYKRCIGGIGTTNYRKLFEIGHVLKYFYEFYCDKDYNDAFLFSFGFNGYIDCLNGLQNNINERKLKFVEFVDNNKQTVLKNTYHPCLKNDFPVKNTILFKKNMIVTGPNASGKTTVLKSSLINILFSQQFGCGFYQAAKLKPYKHIHCYLNIPDTSGRDSLFQAEARRCKEIIDIVDVNKDDTHLCVFDELYSGTNPEEAVVSATAFMEYLIRLPNVSCMLTTHFIKVCKRLKQNESISNYHMVALKTDDRIQYTYKLKSGVSNVKGGINVLIDMNYPREIIDSATKK